MNFQLNDRAALRLHFAITILLVYLFSIYAHYMQSVSNGSSFSYSCFLSIFGPFIVVRNGLETINRQIIFGLILSILSWCVFFQFGLKYFYFLVLGAVIWIGVGAVAI
jgi:hypothetical protein